MMRQSPSHRRRSPSSLTSGIPSTPPPTPSRQGHLPRRRVGAKGASSVALGCIGIACFLAATLLLSVQDRPLSLSVQQRAMEESSATREVDFGSAPRVVLLTEKGLYVSSTSSSAADLSHQPPPLLPLPPRWIQESHFDIWPERDLEHSESYKPNEPKPLETEDCQLQYEWQRQTFPTCNNVHEQRLQQVKFLGHGGWRDTWEIPQEAFDEPLALKTSSVFYNDRDITAFVLEGQRKDAMVMERLTGHPFILNIYGFCGATHILELAQGGTIKDKFDDPYRRRSNATWLERLHIGVQAAMGLASLHNFDQEGRASVLHGDLDVSQVLAVRHGDDLYYKINDFNLAVFLLEDRQNTTRVCPYYGQYHDYKHRSPEAYDRNIPGQSDRVRIRGTFFIVSMFLATDSISLTLSFRIS